MALEYAIEKLQETNTVRDREQAAVLSGLLAARGGIDIPLPKNEHREHSARNDLEGFLRKTGLSLMDDADKDPLVLSAHELDEQTTERYTLANAAKELLQPYYTAASYKLPLRSESDKNWRGKPKLGEDSIEWTASQRKTLIKRDYSGRPEEVPATITHDLELTYNKGRNGNSPVGLESQIHVSDSNPSRKDPKLALEFKDSSVTALQFNRGTRNHVHDSLGLPTLFGEAYDAKISLDPDNLSIEVKYFTLVEFSEINRRSKVTYAFDASLKKFVASEYNERLLKEANLPTELTQEQFLSTVERLAEVFIPVK